MCREQKGTTDGSHNYHKEKAGNAVKILEIVVQTIETHLTVEECWR